MNKSHHLIHLTQVLNVPFRLITVLFLIFSALSLEPAKPVSAAAGSTRVMCENDPSLVGCWRMEEGSGTTLYDGGAEPYNDASTVGSPDFVGGQIGDHAISLNGSQYASTGNEASLNITGSITLAAWVYTTKTGTQYVIKKAANGSTDGYELALASTGFAFVRFNQKTSANTYRVDATNPNSYPLNTWFHLAATYDGTTTILYINGAEVKSGVGPASIVSNTLPVSLGSESTLVSPLSGRIDDARVYNRALNAIDIAALASNTPPGDTNAPAAPTGLAPTPGNTTVGLTWTAPTDPDVKGYNVYRSETSPVDTSTPINGALVTTESYNDSGLTNGTPYFYTVKAVDTSGNVSASADEATATPEGVATCYALTINPGVNGSTPSAVPTKSGACLTQGEYVAGEGITLTASPGAGYHVSGWTGTNNDSSTDSTNTVTMPAGIHTVGVTYTQSEYTLTVTSGHGTVVKDPDQPTYHEGDTVSLTATATPPWTFTSWSGGLTGTDNPTMVTVHGNTSVTANYTLDTSGLCGSDPSLVGCWQMEENGGTTLVDGSSFANNGTTTGSPTWVTGKTGSSALALDGTGQYGMVPDSDSLDLTTDFTIAGWIAPGKSATQDLFKKATLAASANVNGYEIGLSGSTLVFFRINQTVGPDTYRINSTTLYPTTGTTWMHVAGTYSGGVMKLYINGVQEGGDKSGVSPEVNTQAFYIGSQQANPRYYQGAIDDVRLYNRALSLAEIRALAGITPPTCYALTLSSGPNGSAPTASPTKSIACTTAGEYIAGETITLTSHPDSGYQVASWTGTDNDSLKTATNTLTMPAGIRTVTVTYEASTPAAYALQFDGTNDYVNLTTASGLGTQNFTVETWFKRTAVGASISTGSNGVTLVPLIAKGAPQADGTSVDENYVLGIRSSDNVLAGDFEIYAACSGRPAGDNNPIVGVTPILNNTWYHAAFTYDGTALKLYLNGNLERTLASTCIPRYDNTQPAALGTTLTTTPTAQGFFAGVMDEARIWSVARTQEQIRGDINNQLLSGTNLIARWGMNEGSGTTIASSIGSFTGALTNGPTWVTPGAPFNITFDTTPPVAPTGLTAIPGNASIALDWTDNTDPDLAGYNVYRGTTSGVYAKVNSSLVTTSAYSDTGLTNGTEYYYVVRAVDTSNNESTDSNEAYSIPTIASGSAIQFDGVDDYVTFGTATGLGTTNFTLETWFNWTGGGTTMTTSSTQGLPSVYPLISKGRGEADGSNVDMNYFLGIDSATHALAVDFEDMATGMNYPFVGTTVVSTNTWHHAAVTYDSVNAVYQLYLDGAPAGTMDIAGINILPRSDSIQHAGLASAMTSTGSPSGYFQGSMDEARIWNVVRSQTEIISTINQKITSGTGLVARWGMDEGGGTTIVSSIGSFPGTLTNGPVWAPGAPFNLNLTPASPTLVSPADTGTGISTSPDLSVHVSDSRNSDLTVSFYGRLTDGPPGADFTLVAIPDPQNYAASYPSIYNSQMNWVVSNKTTDNIKYVMSLGDNVNTQTISSEWTAATTAWNILTTGGVPFGLAVGNHDGGPSDTANFNTNFGSSLSSQLSFGGRYGTSDYDNRYATFSASGMDFIVVFIEYDSGMTSTSNPVLVWANGILAANPTKRAIVVTHDLLSGNSFSAQGSAIYGALKGNPNLFLMLGGHADTTGQRSDIYEGHTVYSLRSDYQFVDSSQSGYLRRMRFSPVDNKIYVTTYSPWQTKSLTDSANQFELAYAMDGSTDFALIGSTTVPSGSDATISWPGLLSNEQYEWYAVADNGGAAAVSATWTFTTQAITNQPPVVTDIPDQTIAEGASFTTITLDNYVSDVDNTDAQMAWSYSGNSALTVTIDVNRVATISIPNTEWNGAETITFRATDPGALWDEDASTFTVTAVNDPPVAVDDSYSTPINTDLIVTGAQLKANDTDVDNTNSQLSVTAVSNPVNGTVGLVSGTVTFSPTTDFIGAAGFDYTVSDGALTDTGHVTVTVTAPDTFQLNVSKDGTGTGTVTSEPAGINCGADCSETFAVSSVVTLTATADGPSTFTGWSGAGCTGTGTCVVTMDAAKAVTATFTRNVHSISLVLGWNLVSFNLHPTSTAITDVLAPIEGNYDLVYAWDASVSSDNWQKFIPGAGFGNTLNTLEEARGYWIHMTNPGTLNIYGSKPTSTGITLHNDAGGWNLVGYPSAGNHSMPEAFSTHGVGTDLSLVYANHASDTGDPWKMYDKNGPVYANDLLELAPGWGYWVMVTADHPWGVNYIP